MKQESGDSDLRIRFQELRDDVNVSVPPFTVAQAPSARRMWPVWALASAGAAAGLAALLWTGVIGTGQTPEPALDLSVVAWAAPSDFLLDTPGRDLLNTIPTINDQGFAPVNFGPDESVIDTSD